MWLEGACCQALTEEPALLCYSFMRYVPYFACTAQQLDANQQNVSGAHRRGDAGQGHGGARR